MKKLLLILLLVSCGDKTPPSNLSEAMNWLNDPRGVPGAEGPLVTQVDSLPSSGRSSREVWTSSWYPFYDGGTLVATRKYDQAVGAQASSWEQSEVNSMGNVSWGGHCNGLAAASTMEAEPKHGLYYNGVWFSTDDVKALLVEAWNGGGTVVGGRCNQQAVQRDGYGRPLDENCRDLNPGTLHLVVTNFLGIWKKPVIVDADGGEQVWNFPVVYYRITYNQPLSRQDAASWFGGYPFNPYAASMRYIQMELTYASGTIATFEYVLELDVYGNILGGEWFRDNRTSHPDFIWRHTVPTLANPYLDVGRIYDIYRRSL